MGLFSKLFGTSSSFFQLGGPNSPGFNTPLNGGLEVKDPSNTVLVNLRGADPLLDQDFATKTYVDQGLAYSNDILAGINDTLENGTARLPLIGMGPNGIPKNANVDASGNIQIVAPNLLPIGGNDGTLVRAPRYDRFGTQRTTSDTLLFFDQSFQGSTLNTAWSLNNSGMASGFVGGTYFLNNTEATTANSSSGIVNQRQFPILPQAQLRCHFRANAGWASLGGTYHTSIDLGFGTSNSTTNETYFAGFTFNAPDGGLYASIINPNNSTQPVFQLLLSNANLPTTYCDYDIVLGDGYVRFIVCGSSGIPLVDKTISVPGGYAGLVGKSSVSTNFRIWTDATGGGVFAIALISEHLVWLTDAAMGMPWAEQSALSLHQAGVNPTTYAGTSQNFGSAPGTLTPANGSAGYSTLGGEYVFATVVGAETPCSIFGFQIPSPYSFLLTGLSIPAPIVATTIATTGVAFIEWMISSNATTNLLSTGGGIRQGAGGAHSVASAAATQGSIWSGGAISWQPKTPILCLPGTWLHIGFKILGATVVTTAGTHRGTVTVDGYFM